MRISYLLYFLAISAFIQCKRDNTIETDASQQPILTKDSIVFDTVFTTIGTTTEFFKVKNPSNKTLEIDRIFIETGANSNYRMNVDGEPGFDFSKVRILPKDSIFIFVEATVNPNGGNTPLIVEDKIIFETLGKTKHVTLFAWGQDAIYHRADTYIAGLPPFVVLPENEVWTPEKPHVIFGYAVVDSARSLRIEAGTQVHFHNASGLWVYRGGQITVNGTPDKLVVFQGDRLESFFDDAPGQWDRIWINEGQAENIIRGAVIKNGLIGLQVEPLPFDPLSPTSSNTLTLENLTLQNHSGIGLLARNYRINATNVIIGDAGTYGLAISGGGNYNFNHVTIANYYSEKPRVEPGILITNVYQDAAGDIQIRPIENLSINNSIMDGSQETEYEFALNDEVTNTILIQNTLVKSKPNLDGDIFQSCFRNQDPGFQEPNNNNFDLLINAFARDRGVPTGVNTDIKGGFRDFNPDLGAHEYDGN